MKKKLAVVLCMALVLVYLTSCGKQIGHSPQKVVVTMMESASERDLELDGYGVTRQIGCMERPDAAMVPILAIMDNAFSKDEVRSDASGMNGHISKPVDPDTLYAELAKILLDAERDRRQFPSLYRDFFENFNESGKL
ncbi:response regulator [Eisenbergiella sp.]